MAQMFQEIDMRMSEGVAGQRHLGEDTKDDRQDKMSGGRTVDKTRGVELREGDAPQGGVGVLAQTTGVR